MAEPKRRYLVPGYILPPFEKTSSQCFKILTYHKIKPSNSQLHKCTHISHKLYLAGNFPYLTKVEESGDQHAHLNI